MSEEWERLYFMSKSRDQGSTVAIRDLSSDFNFNKFLGVFKILCQPDIINI